jgi:NAD+--asparagine ADP-ribosyltransferase
MDAPTKSRRLRRSAAVVAKELRAEISTLGITEKVEVRVADLSVLLREVGK